MSDKGACPKCGAETDPSASVCPSCGAELAQAEASPAAPPTPSGPSAGLKAARLLAGIGLAVSAMLVVLLIFLNFAMQFQGQSCEDLILYIWCMVLVLLIVNLLLNVDYSGPRGAARSGPSFLLTLGRLLAALFAALSAPFLWFGLRMLMDSFRYPSSGGNPLLAFALVVAVFVLQIGLIAALGRRWSEGWYVVLVLAAGMALFAMPVGLVIAGPLLYWWLKPRTKAWFGVPGYS